MCSFGSFMVHLPDASFFHIATYFIFSYRRIFFCLQKFGRNLYDDAILVKTLRKLLH